MRVAWSVMVSEFMLQQTPVARVLPVHEAWLARWPTPAALAAEPSRRGGARLGPAGLPAPGAAAARRGDRDRRAATAARCPRSTTTCWRCRASATTPRRRSRRSRYGRRHVVLDTNVRRVFARAVTGVEFPATAVTRAERDLAAALLPDDEPTAATWAVAVMELGALVCTAPNPSCPRCPIADRCAWRAAGHPAYDGPPRKVQTYAGTDRQCRGRLLAVLRDSDGAVPQRRMDATWADPVQRGRCLDSLLADGLVVRTGAGSFALP